MLPKESLTDFYIEIQTVKNKALQVSSSGACYGIQLQAGRLGPLEVQYINWHGCFGPLEVPFSHRA